MTEIKILHAADLHLDSPFEGLSAGKASIRRAEQRELLGRIADICREERPDLVLLSGDLLDSEHTYFETGEELPLTLSMMIDEIGMPNVGVNFDPANLISSGRGNPCDAMELLGCKVTGMHAKDSIPPKFGEYGGKQVPIGLGRVDFPRLFEQLKGFGYKGDIVIEHEMKGRENRDADIIAAKKYLEEKISEAGI